MFRWPKKKRIKEELNQNIQLFEKSTSISKNLQINLQAVRRQIGHSSDVVIRSFQIENSKLEAAVVYIDGLADEQVINDQILKPVLLELRKIGDVRGEKALRDELKRAMTTLSKIKTAQQIESCISHILSGGTVFFVDSSDEALLLSTPGWETRVPSEPTSEPYIRGAREGFVETLTDNIVLLRRRIRDPDFTVDIYKVGRRSKTDIAVAYIRGLANQELVDEVKRRIEQIDIDMIQETGYIEQLIEDNFLSPFPQVLATERPDKVAGILMEGFVAVLVDNTPFVLIVPATLSMFLQTGEDYYERWIFSSMIRMLRLLISFIALFLPAIYVALVSFHQNLIPMDLMISIAANREGVPFPSLIEALIMEMTIEILREAGLRLPKPIGQAVGIVGGLVIGEAAVRAGIVSPIMVIVVALTAISSFALPEYAMGIAIRMLRFPMMLVAGALGLYGIMLGYIMINVHLVKLKSFGIDYLAPYVPYRLRDWKDLMIRAPIKKMRQRPQMMKTQDPQRKDS